MTAEHWCSTQGLTWFSTLTATVPTSVWTLFTFLSALEFICPGDRSSSLTMFVFFIQLCSLAGRRCQPNRGSHRLGVCILNTVWRNLQKPERAFWNLLAFSPGWSLRNENMNTTEAKQLLKSMPRKYADLTFYSCDHITNYLDKWGLLEWLFLTFIELNAFRTPSHPVAFLTHCHTPSALMCEKQAVENIYH